MKRKDFKRIIGHFDQGTLQLLSLQHVVAEQQDIRSKTQ